MQSPELAIYALLTSPDQTITDLKVSLTDIQSSLHSLPTSNSKFLTKLKQVLMEKSMKENTKSTSKTYNIPEFLLIELLRKYLNEEANIPGNTFYPFDTFDRFTQTFELPMKNWMHVASQTDLPYKSPKRSYSTLEKIEEVKKSLKGDSSVSSGLLEKWKEKVTKKLFQEEHCSVYVGDKKDKFCLDVDSVLVEWVKKQNGFVVEEFKKKCLEVAEGGNVTDAWVNAFKSFYSLG